MGERIQPRQRKERELQLQLHCGGSRQTGIVQPCSCTSQELASEHIWDLQVKPMTAVGNPLKMLLIKSMRQIIQLELVLKRLKKQNKTVWGKSLVKRNEFKIQHHHKNPLGCFRIPQAIASTK